MWEFIVGAAVLAVGVLIGWAINATQEPPVVRLVDFDRKGKDDVKITPLKDTTYMGPAFDFYEPCVCGDPGDLSKAHAKQGDCYPVAYKPPHFVQDPSVKMVDLSVDQNVCQCKGSLDALEITGNQFVMHYPARSGLNCGIVNKV